MSQATFRIWRGEKGKGEFRDYSTEAAEGMVVLDAVHQIQAEQANDLAVRWNCKAGKCGSCSAEINGMPKLMCMTRLNALAARQARDHRADARVSAHPRSGHGRVLELSRQDEDHRNSSRANPTPPTAPGGWQQADIDRVQEFRKCIECFLCQDVCHVLRDHHMHDEFIGPRFLVYTAALEMHPLDTGDRVPAVAPGARHRLVQHHQVLHQGLPREHHHHRQRHHSAEGTRGGPVLRPIVETIPHVWRIEFVARTLLRAALILV